MIPGLDVHAGYGRLSWKLVAASGYRFAYCKSTQGNDPQKDDLTWKRNVQEAQANGMAAGVYHFAYPLPYGEKKPAGRHPIEQAERFHTRVGGHGSLIGQLAPAVDAEWPPPEEWEQWGCTATQINDWLREHCHAVALLFGRLPVIYTYPAWWRALIHGGADTGWAAKYPLWLASYTWLGPGTPPRGWETPHLSWVRETWEGWSICQHSAEGSKVRIPGITACPVDRNVIRDMTTLRRLLGDPEDDECEDRGAA